MSSEIKRFVITRVEGKTVCAYLIGETIYDLIVDEVDGQVRVGDVFVGKVQNVVDNIRAAFVEIRPGVMGYLPLSESERKSVKGEQELVVQVKKPAKGTKDPVLTRNIEFVGRYVMLQDNGQVGVSISKKIKDEDVVNRLQGLIGEVDASVTIRTNAAGAGDDVIVNEYNMLHDKLLNIRDHGEQRTLYSRLYSEPVTYLRLINSYRTDQVDRIITDDKDIFNELKEAIPELDVEMYEDASYPLDARYAISTTMKKAEDRLVWLKSGANLIIDKTEAMTVIDVNSAKAIEGKRASEGTFFKINMEAADEVARQLRLRNMSGIILVDFIDMKDPDHNDRLIAHLRDCLKQDPVRAMYVDMTKLGIIEITRAKR